MSRILNKHVEAKRFEQELAQDLGGRRVFLSGAGFVKSDVRRTAVFRRGEEGVERSDALSFRAEAKTTQYDSFTLRSVDWFDVARAADAAGEIPLFAIRFLRTGYGLALIRLGFARELEVEPTNDTVLPIVKSMTLRPGAHNILRAIYPNHPGPTKRPDMLVVLPYDTFIERVQTHASFAQEA